MPTCLDSQTAGHTNDYQAGQAYDGNHRPQCRPMAPSRIASASITLIDRFWNWKRMQLRGSY